DLPVVKKAIISFWFRVPQASIDACAAARESKPATVDQNLPAPTFNGQIPLLSLGPAYDDGYLLDQASVTLATYVHNIWVYLGGCEQILSDSFEETIEEQQYSEGDAYSYGPSYIGIDCTEDGASLCLRLQTPDYPDMSGVAWKLTEATSSTLDQLSQVGIF